MKAGQRSFSESDLSSQISRANATSFSPLSVRSRILAAKPFGLPLGLPDCPGLNCVCAGGVGDIPDLPLLAGEGSASA